jgi:hypothetical protein
LPNLQTLKFVEVILRKRRGKRENNGGDKPNQGTLYAYMEPLQGNSLYDYYTLITMFKKK